ncbi:MAG: DNA-binding transcription factor yap1 [Chrysothrix sp. TS-e1954]|nr:MAG: DNA-binding transcription factor yap1 [Chrysothrix sp. TS-e1954]
MATPLQWPQMDPEQQSLLLAALTSNRPMPSATNESVIDPSVFDAPLQSDFGLGSFDDAAFPDFVGADGTFDAEDSNDSLINNAQDDSPIAEGEGREKRKSFSEDEDDEENGDPKRREGDDKSRKPGRKPIMAEPTTKRKAQNRAAQRAFRERKEHHLKNLETKVLDLERASESANHENGILRAQVDRLQTELKEYRKRISFTGTTSSSPPRTTFPPLGKSSTGAGLVDFDFDFPRFGSLPGSQMPHANSSPNTNALRAVSNGDIRANDASTTSSLQGSLSSYTNDTRSAPQSDMGASKQSLTDPLGNIFSPDSDNSLGKNFGMPNYTSPEPLQKERSGSYASNRTRASPSVTGSATSPSSSGSQQYQGSSSCTSPESFENWTNSYSSVDQNSNAINGSSNTGKKGLQDVALLLSADQCKAGTNSAAKTPGSDFNGSFDWLASQNGGQFDPVLFGDYRDTQNAIVGTNDFTGGLFEDSLPFPDFNDPFNFNMAADTTIPAMVSTPSPAKTQPPTQSAKAGKVDLMEQVRRQREGEEDPAPPTGQQANGSLPDHDTRSLMTCHKIWYDPASTETNKRSNANEDNRNQLQNCPRFKEGDFDIDSLCTELAAKAKCTETGVAVPKEDVEKALWRLAGKAPDQDKLSSMHFPGHETARDPAQAQAN